MEDKEKDNSGYTGLILGFGIPIFVALAPREIRKELFDYTCKFVGIIALIVAGYMFIPMIWEQIKKK